MPEITPTPDTLTAIANELRELPHASLAAGHFVPRADVLALADRLDALAARGEAAIPPVNDQRWEDACMHIRRHGVWRDVVWLAVEPIIKAALAAHSPAPSDAASGSDSAEAREHEARLVGEGWDAGVAYARVNAAHSPAHADAEPRITADVEAVGGINLADVRRRTVAERDYWLDQLTMEVGYLRKRLRSRPASGSPSDAEVKQWSDAGLSTLHDIPTLFGDTRPASGLPAEPDPADHDLGEALNALVLSAMRVREMYASRPASGSGDTGAAALARIAEFDCASSRLGTGIPCGECPPCIASAALSSPPSGTSPHTEES